MKKLLSALVLLALCSSFAMADVPEPGLCSVSPADAVHGVILCPLAGTTGPLTETVNTVTVRNSSNQVIANATVVFLFGPTINVCTTAVHTATTNSSGVCTITLGGGGCQIGAGACQVKANGITIRDFANAKSPDWDEIFGDRRVGPSDFARFAIHFNTPSTPAPCFDYQNIGSVGGSDFATFARAFNRGSNCP